MNIDKALEILKIKFPDRKIDCEIDKDHQLSSTLIKITVDGVIVKFRFSKDQLNEIDELLNDQTGVESTKFIVNKMIEPIEIQLEESKN